MEASLPLLLGTLGTRMSDPASAPPATNSKDGIQPPEIRLLQQFFVLLDQWDQQQVP
jgi:hypothetical protein